MSHEQIAVMTMPQLLLEITPRDTGKNRPVTPSEIRERQQAAQDRVFDEVCHRGQLRPARLAMMSAAELERRVREIVGDTVRINAAELPMHATSYAGRRRQPLRESA